MDQKQQIADRLKQANNILVTVSNNPSVDQLAACIGLTLALNKMNKHATALFSGQPPSTLEFLQPEKTLESNIDSLRDFIISLDKTKADKLRYKVEDSVVKIFITPYRTSLSEHDLEFGQGEFNVDVVLALGVHNQSELDQAITAHGRILHDATVATLNVKPGGELGSINWVDPAGSSLSELALELIIVMDKQVVDAQIATALLTGIVAETDRFRNERTTPAAMSVSAELMAAGANQQLVMTKLEESKPAPPPPAQEIRLDRGGPDQPKDTPPAPAPKPEDGTLEITHTPEPVPEPELPAQPAEGKAEEPSEEGRPLGSLEDLASSDDKGKEKEPATPKIRIDDQGRLQNEKDALHEEKKAEAAIDPTQHMGGSRMILQPPTMGGTMSAISSQADSFGDPLSPPAPVGSDLASSPFSSPASANITPPPTPFMPASMTPSSSSVPNPTVSSPLFGAGPPQQSPFLSGSPGDGLPVTTGGPPPDLTAGAPSLAPTHVDNARDAVSQALSFDPHTQQQGGSLGAPPDLTASASAPVQPSTNIPAPSGSPPPVPPPMMPPAPQ